MHTTLWVLLTAAIVLANENHERRSKLPYVADAVGNTLPPPSNLPATVGSPVNLLTPDRYEFYTFDESGELVKRLMTLEEIQAIVAAGEDTEGLVTFANDNQPTIAFNFSQPPYTKVHSVVTNVQNVLKAQMEAHKNKPQIQPTLDTPDVSDSWSLILPSIFGNTGVDIVPDKTTGSYITPETETIEKYSPLDSENSFSKEGINQFLSSASADNKLEDFGTTTKSTTTHRTTTSTTTLKPTTKRFTKPSASTTVKLLSTSTTPNPKTSITVHTRNKPSASTISTSSNEYTKKQSQTYTATIESTPSSILLTNRPVAISKKPVPSTISLEDITISNNQLQTLSHDEPSTERGDIQYERISTFVPTSTVINLSEKTTNKPTDTTKLYTTVESYIKNNESNQPTTVPLKYQSTTDTTNPKDTYLSNKSSTQNQYFEENNATTITTQSVSPSTKVTTTEFTPIDNAVTQNSIKNNEKNNNGGYKNNITDSEPISPLFDVAQSISQIASDLGGTYKPVPTSSDLLENTKINGIDLESKENMEIEIPTDIKNDNEIKTNLNNNTDNFIKITTLDPHDEIKNNMDIEEKADENKSNKTIESQQNILSSVTTLDPVISESMGDLLSQVVNESPENDLNIEKISEKEDVTTTTEMVTEITVYETEELETTTEGNIMENQVFLSNEIHNGLPLLYSNDTNGTKNDKIESGIENNQENKMTDDRITLSTEKHPNVSTIKNESIKTESIKTEISQHELNFNKEYVKVGNSSLPSYKSETEINDTNTLEPISFISHQSESLEKKEINRNDQIVKGQEELLPKFEEFKKKIQKVNIDDKELENVSSDRNNSWKLIPTVSPTKIHEITKLNNDKSKTDTYYTPESNNKHIILEFSKENQGLELTTKDLGEDIARFTELCNELAFRYWNDMAETIEKKRSFVFSPYALTSMLAMMFMGAKGATSGEMNDILKLDDMVTFNPHFTLKNISDSIEASPAAGVVVSAFIRELYSDRNKGKILTFYKERAQHFYNGLVEEVNFKLISDIIRRRTNLLFKRYTWGKIVEYMKTNTIVMQPPLAALSANIFQTDCTGTSVDGRDGEMYFVVSPNVRQRRLVPVPAVVYKSNFLAGYDPVLDATAAALGNTNSIVSTLFVMPGQQGNIVHAEDLEDLEKRLLESNPTTPAWNQLLRTLLPRIGLELQIPRFSHKSIFNVSSTLKRMGLKDLFDPDRADLGGLNGPSKDLYLSDMIQSNTFATCGEGVIGEQHHIEEYPQLQKRRSARWVTGWNEPRDYQRAFHDPHDVGDAMHLPLHLRPRQARLPARNAQPARLKFDRPFLFFVRHNPTGMILYAGRYNPRLLP